MKGQGFNPAVSTVRGGPSAASHAVKLSERVTIKSRFPAAVVYLKPRADAFRRFCRFLKQHSLGVVVLGPEGLGKHTGTKRAKIVSVGGIPIGADSAAGAKWAWEVVGDAEAIAVLLDDDCVREWHGLVACSVRWSGQGNGAEKVKASKPREKDVRTALTRAVVTGNEVNVEGERLATWEIQSVPAVRPLASDDYDYWTAQEGLTDDGCPHPEC